MNGPRWVAEKVPIGRRPRLQQRVDEMASSPAQYRIATTTPLVANGLPKRAFVPEKYLRSVVAVIAVLATGCATLRAANIPIDYYDRNIFDRARFTWWRGSAFPPSQQNSTSASTRSAITSSQFIGSSAWATNRS